MALSRIILLMKKNDPPPNSFDEQHFLKTLTNHPGVYQMLATDGTVLYVGKANQLKKRVSSYFQKNLTPKTKALMQQVADIRVIVTRSESEALVLENNIIKQYRPRYNILFRDDKNYPYIYATSKDQFPRITFYRGSRKLPGKYFGPFPSVLALRETLNVIQKIFLLRSCSNTFFKNRTRPCLQYQIKRCSGACVNAISQEEYQRDFKHALDLLDGKSEKVLKAIEARMDQASGKLNFEAAAKFRDQIAALRLIQAKQYAVKGKQNIDVIAVVEKNGGVCLHVLVIRHGQVLGNKTFFPKVPKESCLSEVVRAFVLQYYLASASQTPSVIVCSQPFDEKALLIQALSTSLRKTVEIKTTGRTQIKKWQEMAERSAKQALATHQANRESLEKKFDALANVLSIDAIERMECFDISHHAGEATVASCVVFSRQGAEKEAYRRFNIEGVKAGDDYAAMAQALKRHYKRLKTADAVLPDLLVIDGGKGQLKQAENVLETLQIDQVKILGIAKGRTRKPGMETLFLAGAKQAVELDASHEALHLLQQIRDEAHRFAITANRMRVGKARKRSRLELIDGVGAKRRQALLKHFGGEKGLRGASADSLSQVKGISEGLAKKIFDALHS
jgi:excinuclease ABC subunit C